MMPVITLDLATQHQLYQVLPSPFCAMVEEEVAKAKGGGE
jgi:hypothetical protein